MSFDPADGIIFYLVFLYSTILHEAAHAFVAWRLGDDTAYRGGQVSIDPIPHIRRAPVGMIVVPIATLFLSGGRSLMGWASAPFDPEWAQRHPRHSAWMALAGPATNLLLALLAGIVIRMGLEMEWFQAPGRVGWGALAVATTPGGMASFAALLASVVFNQNLLLAAFNMVPVPPFDGASLPLLFLRAEAARAYFTFIQNPTFMWIGLIVAWRAFSAIFPTIQLFAVNLLYWGHATFR